MQVKMILEGEEPPDFWGAFGQKDVYLNKYFIWNLLDNYSEIKALLQRPLIRLYQCTVGSGVFGVEEVGYGFLPVQDDLDQEDVMLLDTGDQIWVWIGRLSAEVERKMAYQVCKSF